MLSIEGARLFCMKNIPNIITSMRLLAALCLAILCLAGSGKSLFLPLFVTAGISDMLDGFIARRFGWCTEFGANLDSISDLTLYVTVALFLTVHAPTAVFQCGGLIILGAIVQVLHWAFCSLKLGGFPAYHTNFSRLCAYLIFAGVIAFWLGENNVALPAVTCLWIACSLEGIVITHVLKQRATDVPGITAAWSRAR